MPKISLRRIKRYYKRTDDKSLRLGIMVIKSTLITYIESTG